jgi:WD40 repeat protein
VSLGNALLPDRQPALVLSMAVVAAAANPAAAAAEDAGPSSAFEGSAGWQLLLAAGKNLGSISVWRSGSLVSNTVTNGPNDTLRAYSRQQLSLAVSTGESSSRRCHGAGFVTGLVWSPLEQQLSSCGADGQLLSWVWTKDGLEVGSRGILMVEVKLHPCTAPATTAEQPALQQRRMHTVIRRCTCTSTCCSAG